MSRAPGSTVLAEMREQPAVLDALFGQRPSTAAQIGELQPEPPTGVLLIARGSSDNAATYARYLLELVIGCPVALAAPSLHTRYGARTRYDGWLAVGFSQSGETPEIVSVLQQVREHGARTVAVTNSTSSSLAAAAHLVVGLGCGPELAVPATKTFTASLAAVMSVASGFGELPWGREDERRTVAAVAAALEDDPEVDEAVEQVVQASTVAHLGRGLTFSVAQEAALKYRETNGRASDGHSVADFLHGPIAAVDEGTCAVAYAAGGPAAADVRDGVAAVRARGGTAVLLGPGPSGARRAEAVPPELPEPLAVLPMAVRAQQLAIRSALRRGIDPDEPFGLSKVTATT